MDWIESRLRELKRSKTNMAAALGITPPRVSEILKGRRRLQSREIVPLARYLKLRPDDVLRRIERSGDRA